MLKFPDKTPTDELTREFIWSDWLQEGDTISVSPAPIISTSNGLTVEGSLVSNDGTSVTCMVTGGTADQTYEISCTIWTEETGEKVTRYATQKVKAKL